MIKDNEQTICPESQISSSTIESVNFSNYKYHLTFDIDWAPDFCISNILNKLKNAQIKATFFVTHLSDIIVDIINQGHNVGLHPNFLPNSSQGKNLDEIMDYLFKIAPNAIALRTHALVQSSPLLWELFSKFPQLKFDISLFTYKFPLVKVFDWTFEGVSFKRINYNWEDDCAFFDSEFLWNKPKFYSDITVFDFHPIHVALNSRDNKNYNRLKNNISGKPLWQATEDEVKKTENY